MLSLAKYDVVYEHQTLGVRGCDEHRRMKWGDVQLLTDVDAAEYLEFSERQTKTRTGAEPRNVRAVKPKAYGFANGSPDIDPVVVDKVDSEKRPSSMSDSDSPFYLGINHTKNPTEKPWFTASAMGVNKLNSLISQRSLNQCTTNTNYIMVMTYCVLIDC